MLAILDRQHGTRHRDWAPGAAADLDGDGVVEVHEQEARITPLYAIEAAYELLSRGHEVELFSVGHYSERHAHAMTSADHVAPAKTAYVACHLNAAEPPGDYGMVLWRRGSRVSHHLAACLAAQLEILLPELSSVKIVETSPNDWTQRAHATVSGIKCDSDIAAVCFEPCFINQPTHRGLLVGDGPARIGNALAAGLLQWERS